METLIEILEDIQPGIDYETCTDLIDAHHLDSLSIISLVAEIEDCLLYTSPSPRDM